MSTDHKAIIDMFSKHRGNVEAIASELGLSIRSTNRKLKAAKDAGLIAYGRTDAVTDVDRRDAEALIDLWKQNHHNTCATARVLKLALSTTRGRIDRALRILGVERAALVPVNIPDSMKMGKTTVQYDAAGNAVQEWRRLHPQAETLQLFVDELLKIVDSKAPVIPKPDKPVVSDLMLEIPFFDVHVGKYCWEPETGTAFDLKICEELLTGTAARIAAEAGEFDKALMIIGGDFFHADSRHATTERGGNHLDVDSRQYKVWQVATRALHTNIEMLLQRCNEVMISIIPGNHDHESSFHLMRVLEAYYRNDDRVKVLASPRTRCYIHFGTNLIGIAHGDVQKLDDLPSMMAAEMPEAWAATKERVWHLGHIHKTKTLSDTKHGVLMEHLESLTATDAWHHWMGYVGTPRRVTGFLWHKKHGLKRRIYVNVDELRPTNLDSWAR